LFVALNSLDHSEIDFARRWWQDRPEELADFRREHGLNQGPVVFFLSRLLPANRADLLIQATAALVSEFPALKTVIIGNGQPEKERLVSLAAQAGVAGNVIFQDGIYDEMRLAPWFLSANLVCYPANMGLSLLHSFWYGVPVVTHRNLDIQGPEVAALEHGVNGLSYDYGNVASLAGAMRQIITDERLRESMSHAARRTVENRFTIPRMVDGLEAAIRYANNSSSVGCKK
jgi:glycosyltransferase involved in cell wall biosynthesis